MRMLLGAGVTDGVYFLSQMAMNDLLLSGLSLPHAQPQQKQPKEAQCYICGHKFRWDWLLRRHMRTHTGEKPFSCPYCQYRANRKEMIRSHIFHRHLKPQAGHQQQLQPVQQQLQPQQQPQAQPQSSQQPQPPQS